MRKSMLVVALAVLGSALLASSASAFDHHFTVLSKTTSGHRSGNTFRFKDKLLDPNNRSVKVGRDRGRCTVKGHNHHVVKCRAVAHLNGKIGGFGDIRVHGDFTRHDNRLNVVGGSGQFDGVAGKMKLHGTSNKRIDRLHFDLTR
jgi:hypothetical protein